MANSDPAPVVLALIEDDKIRALPDSDLARRVVEINTGFEHFQAIAASAASLTVRHAIALGQIFAEAFRRHEGEFADWLSCAVGENAEGKPRICEKTALRYRTLWHKRDRLFPADGSEPECRTLQEAYIKCGLMPAPLTTDPAPADTAAFRVSFTLPPLAPEQWAPADRRAFLEKTEPIAQLREKLAALAA